MKNTSQCIDQWGNPGSLSSNGVACSYWGQTHTKHKLVKNSSLNNGPSTDITMVAEAGWAAVFYPVSPCYIDVMTLNTVTITRFLL